jgi:hypothetical protein
MTPDQEAVLLKAVDYYLADCRYNGCPPSTRHISAMVVASVLGPFRFSQLYRYEKTPAHRAIFEAVDTLAANLTADKWQGRDLSAAAPPEHPTE